MTRTVVLISTNQVLNPLLDDYPRVYYGNGVNEIGKNVLSKFFIVPDIEDLETYLTSIGMTRRDDLKVSSLWYVDHFFRLHYDEDGSNPDLCTLLP